MRKKVHISVGVLVAAVVVFILVARTKQSQQLYSAKPTYIAMGDSVSAGIGLPGESDSSACNRTDSSYPAILSKIINYEVINISCSGATVASGLVGKQNVNKLLIDTQLDQLFSYKKPKLITMTIGANDVGWVSVLSKCVIATCGTDEDSAIRNAKFDTLAQDISGVLDKIKNHYDVNPSKVLMTGYYEVVSPNLTCSDTAGVTPAEASWIIKQQQEYNRVLRNVVASYDFVTYVPISFENHTLCSTESWVQGLTERAPYHPNEAGQTSIAQQVAKIISK